MFRTSNPALRNDAYSQSWDDLGGQVSYQDRDAAVRPAASKQMTLQGTVNKSAFLLALCIVCAMGSWHLSLDVTEAGASMTGYAMPLLFGGLFGGLILGLICSFAPKTSPFLSPLYAIAEGGALGALSGWYASAFAQDNEVLNTGLILSAATLTFGIFGGLLVAYSTKLIRPNRMFYNIVTVGTIGVCFYALIAIGARFLFGDGTLISVYDPSNGGMISIGFSLLLVGLASANLILDFDLINNGVKNRAPKYMEWYSGFALLVTLVWLYIEVLRLLAKLQSRE